MRHKRLLAVLAAALLLVLAACGAGGSDNGMTEGTVSDSFNSAREDASMESPGWAGESGFYDQEAGAPQTPGNSGGGTLPSGAKMIYTADMSLETTEFDSAIQALDHIVTGLGGWFESRTINQGGGYRSLSCTIRVPAESFTALLDQAGQAAHMTYRQEYQNDVSESYYDTETRLATQRTKLARLQQLLSQAQDMADIITLESAISDAELEIEYLTGSLRHYDSLIGYSTVTLSLREVYRLSDEKEPAVSFGQRLSEAFSDGFRQTVEALEDLAVFLARSWVALLVLAVIVAVLAAALRAEKRRKRRKAEQTPPPAGPEEK